MVAKHMKDKDLRIKLEQKFIELASIATYNGVMDFYDTTFELKKKDSPFYKHLPDNQHAEADLKVADMNSSMKENIANIQVEKSTHISITMPSKENLLSNMNRLRSEAFKTDTELTEKVKPS